MNPNIRITVEGEGDAGKVFTHAEDLRLVLEAQGFVVSRLLVEESKGGDK